MAALLGMALTVAVAAPVGAAEAGGSVPGTVTVEATVACLIVEGGYEFGTQPLAATAGLPVAHQSLTNASVRSCSTQGQDVLVRGTDAIGSGENPAEWDLDPAVTTGSCSIDSYGLTTNVAGGGPRLTLGLTDATLTSTLPDASFAAGANLFMPCAGSSGGGETMTFSVVYTAVLGAATGPYEVEPNADNASATLLAVGVNSASSIFGGIGPVGDLDVYRVALQPGDVTVETFDASGADTCLQIDTVIAVYNGSTNTNVGVDDDSGPGFCSSFAFQLTSPATIYITVGDFSDDHLVPGYRLRVSHG